MTVPSPARRAAAWLLMLLFAAVVGEPLRGHACPVHAALGAVAQEAGSGDAHGGHGSHAAHVAATDETPAQGEHDSHLCDCLGTCSGTAVVRVPQTLALRLVEVGIVEEPAPPARLTPVATSGDHVLPFANGPPALA